MLQDLENLVEKYKNSNNELDSAICADICFFLACIYSNKGLIVHDFLAKTAEDGVSNLKTKLN